MQDGSASGGLATRRARPSTASRGAQPEALPLEDGELAASPPRGRAAGSAATSGAMGKTRSREAREERERRRRASLPAIADQLAEATLALPRQGPTTVNTYTAFAHRGPGPVGRHEDILINILRGELHAAMQLMDHREAWWMQGMRNAESAVGSERTRQHSEQRGRGRAAHARGDDEPHQCSGKHARDG